MSQAMTWTDLPWIRDRRHARQARDESIAALARTEARAEYQDGVRAALTELRRRNHLVAGMLDIFGTTRED